MSSTPIRLLAALVLAAALSVTTGVTLAPPAGAAVHRCGDFKKAGYLVAKKVTAKNVSCKKAKNLIHKYFLPGMDLHGFTCKGYPRQSCKKGKVVVAFTYP
jgi:hypothetical protein